MQMQPTALRDDVVQLAAAYYGARWCLIGNHGDLHHSIELNAGALWLVGWLYNGTRLLFIPILVKLCASLMSAELFKI